MICKDPTLFKRKDIGNWHVLTDGSDYLIPEVNDLFNKLNYIKSKFNLTI
ncbi:hypothetical protein IC006_0621 [Sulfuracidifex tepidarius]|uniref:Uncharacterized protein n=1 Tax=Sulfuracidifex tepidarius TaxID=1294262 RepID=A0A510DT67_9CREN|nr:hypothetical protein IC006_0621 [Sulfuracidifex tepidarius]BBG26089.1 hypothetical protein IC007_0594 [Sulfuracidifex tepidarius]